MGDKEISKTFEVDVKDFAIEEAFTNSRSPVISPQTQHDADVLVDSRTSLFSIRGSDRYVYVGGHTIRLVDHLQVQATPLKVDLTQGLIDRVYEFFFPPSSMEISAALALVNPRLSKEIPHTHTYVSNAQPSPTLPTRSTKREKIYFKYVRISPVSAEINFRGSFNLQNVNLNFESFVQRHKFKSWKELIDKYMWLLGRQATPTVIGHKIKGMVKRKNSGSRIRQEDEDSKMELLFGKER